MRDRIRKQVDESEGILAPSVNIPKEDLRKLSSLIMGFNGALNRAISDFVKSGDTELLNFNVNGVEENYNAIVSFLADIDFKMKADVDKDKVKSAINEVLPAVQMLKARLDSDPDVSLNEKNSINSIFANLSTYNFVPLGAYSVIDETTNRDRSRVRQDAKESSKQARYDEMMDVLQSTVRGTEALNEKIVQTQSKLEQLQTMKDALEATADNTGATLGQLGVLEKQIEGLTSQLARQERDLGKAEASAAEPSEEEKLFKQVEEKLSKLKANYKNPERAKLIYEARSRFDDIKRGLQSGNPDTVATAMKWLQELSQKQF
jgi:chromosome segregation ATPase